MSPDPKNKSQVCFPPIREADGDAHPSPTPIPIASRQGSDFATKKTSGLECLTFQTRGLVKSYLVVLVLFAWDTVLQVEL